MGNLVIIQFEQWLAIDLVVGEQWLVIENYGDQWLFVGNIGSNKCYSGRIYTLVANWLNLVS